MRLCRSYRSQSQAACNNVVGEIKSIGNVTGKPMVQVDDLTTILRTQLAQTYVTYNVETFNDRGRTSGPSNAVTIFLAPSLPAPSQISVSLPSRNAVMLQWTGAPLPAGSRGLNKKYVYKIFRRGSDQPNKAPV